mmetsp:Transcript_68581/g.155415  ORF Transcript_68581/g.155415 Transcript_68581/m.155415 type:complete len:205 (-) Transcript_68581:105-719(-)|eukprot:CAMPEP_0197886634 /NCGR_PEP_ID=MMETSP1439-20131203/17084_1 /TAXON_ID=66791 /ORGANISM="Gonyaulax spinifera, Strain CCMP409" /LENGTH=204 /DNA_ID=CAMNT_0043506441 /DNA_START=71 /DNA_END=685 /DNA_ORIENTATION=-
MFCTSACQGGNPATDSVQVDLSVVNAEAEADRLHAEHEEADRLAREEEREAERVAGLEAQKRAEEEERQRLEEQRAKEETARLKKEEAARREEAEHQARLKEEQERKEALDTFCKRYGFADIRAPRRSGCAVLASVTTYPLHWAAELGDARVVEMLLKEGVDTTQKNSAGKIAAQVAQKKDKGGSHQAVRSLLGDVAAPRSGGA